MNVSLDDILYVVDGLSPLDEAPTYVASELQKLAKTIQKTEQTLQQEIETMQEEMQDKIDSLEADVERLNSELVTYQYLFPSHGQS